MKNTYVKTDDGEMIYKLTVERLEENSEGREGYITYSLDLVCGKDYVSDNYDFQSWCSPEYFVDDVKYDSLLQYFESESLEDVLDENGYELVNELPSKIWQWGEEPTDVDMFW